VLENSGHVIDEKYTRLLLETRQDLHDTVDGSGPEYRKKLSITDDFLGGGGGRGSVASSRLIEAANPNYYPLAERLPGDRK